MPFDPESQTNVRGERSDSAMRLFGFFGLEVDAEVARVSLKAAPPAASPATVASSNKERKRLLAAHRQQFRRPMLQLGGPGRISGARKRRRPIEKHLT